MGQWRGDKQADSWTILEEGLAGSPDRVELDSEGGRAPGGV